MRIAIPIWNGFVSNVFDFAGELVVVDAKDRKETGRSHIQLGQQAMQQRAGELVRHHVDVLVCGGISGPLAVMLRASNIEVIPFVTGPVEEVLIAYFNDQLTRPQFLQPGCEIGDRERFCRRRAGHPRRCRYGPSRNRPPERQGWDRP